MTMYNDKTALTQFSSPLLFLHSAGNDIQPNIKEPGAEYSANTSPTKSSTTTPTPITTLCDQLEQHLARYHFHHLSLMAMGKEEYDNSDWEFGAHLAGRSLQEESELLMTTLSQHKLSSSRST